MSTDLESFAEFLREKLATGEAHGKPEDILQQWRDNGGHSQATHSDANSSETLFDRLNRKGLLATVEGGPCDLSTNPKYMEGFGES
jgi:hypothetical protein